MTFQPPDGWTRLQTLDAHTGGEPLRILTGGWPEVPGDSMGAKRRYCREHLDHLRRALMLEPRGHADMYGCVLTEPVTPDGDVGVLFLHNEGYSTMCGHGIIGLVTVGLEAGLFSPRAAPIVRIDTPAGRVTATAHMHGARVRRVSFENVPSFLVARDVELQVPGLGRVVGDLGYGGAYYLYVEASSIDLEVELTQVSALTDAGRRIKRAFSEAHQLRHPSGDTDQNFLYGVIFSGPGSAGAFARNVCVFADGEVDRSPTGTGVSGRAAVLHARGDLPAGQPIVIESLTSSRFEVEVLRQVDLAGQPAIIPRVTGSAHMTGRHEFWVDPEDPLGAGFLLR